MRSLYQSRADLIACKRASRFSMGWEPTRFIIILLLSFSGIKSAVAIYPNTNPETELTICQNVTNGGTISGDELGCPSPSWDPSPIINVTLPSGGVGELEYIWMYTTGNPLLPLTMWVPIPNSNFPAFDPGPISQTTHYRRFSKRSGCPEYSGESNIITKDAACCSNVTGGGLIGQNQTNCISPFDASELKSIYLPNGGAGNLYYQWVSSETGSQYTPANPDWSPIPGANNSNYDPGPLTKTTWFIRLARRHGCTEYEGISNMVKVAIESPVRITSLETQGVTCFGGNDGSIKLTYEGAQFPVHFSWSPSIGNIKDPTNLKAGVYSVTLSDALGCMATASTSIAEGAKINVGLTSKPETCLGGNDGTANVAWVTGGTPTYTYTWSNGQTGTGILNLSPKSYSVTATDTKGCKGIETVIVQDGQPLDISMHISAETCLGAGNGAATVTLVGGGTGGFVYNWSHTNMPNTPGATGLMAGNYGVSVTDGRGCRGSKAFTIAKGAELEVNLSTSSVSCNGNMDGEAQVIAVIGGTAPLSYQWNDTNKQTSTLAANLAAGNYRVIVRDALGCTGSGSVAVSEPAPVSINLSQTPPRCSYTFDGTAMTLVSGGTAPYNYRWNNAQFTPKVENLSPANYQVTVTDVNGCSVSGSIDVKSTSPISASVQTKDISCFGLSDASIKVIIPDDEPGMYNYAWSGGITTNSNVANDLKAGYYVVTVTNPAGCFTTVEATINSPEKLEVALTAQKPSCYGNSDGVALAQARGGTPLDGAQYLYSWDAPGNPEGQQLGSVPGGLYTVSATDAQGCIATSSINIESPSALSSFVDVKPVTCFGKNNGAISVIASGGVAPYNYNWNTSSGASGHYLENLVPGPYSVTISDINGCTKVEQAEIEEPSPLSMTINATDVLCENNTDGSLITRVVGGTSPYNYVWSGMLIGTSPSGLRPGSYTVTVTDAADCQITNSAEIKYTSNLSVSVSTQNASCYGGSDGMATAKGQGGSGNYTYSWSNGSTGPTAKSLSPGIHKVSITDGSGCSAVANFSITAPGEMKCNLELIKPISTYGGNDGIIQASASGWNGILQYAWDNGSKSGLNDGLGRGTHNVTITDSNNCSCTASLTLFNPSKIGDRVWNDINQNGIQETVEPGIENVQIRLSGHSDSGVSINKTTTTSDSGLYFFDGLEPGKYRLEFLLPESSFFSPLNIGDPKTDSDVNPYSGLTDWIMLGSEEFADNWDAGIIVLDENINLGDLVWEDINRNGIQDEGEKGMSGIRVRLLAFPAGNLVAELLTDVDGKYLFKDVVPGSYVVEFQNNSLPDGYVLTKTKAGSDWAKDSDADPATGRTGIITVAPYTLDNLSIDAGLYKSCDNVYAGGHIGNNESFCGANALPAKINSISLPSGGQGNITYLWLSNSSPGFKGIGDSDWKPVSGSSGPELVPSAISASTFYVRLSKREGCNDFGAHSNVVSKSLSPLPLTQITGVAAEVCLGENLKVEALNAGSGSTYYWTFSGEASPVSSTLQGVEKIRWETEGFKNITLSVSRFGCTQSIVQTIRVKKCEPPLSFTTLKAVTHSDNVVLSWRVNSDSDNIIYFVQRSEDGIAFDNLGAISGAQRLADGSFTFTDTRPLFGDNFYRIYFKRNQESGYSDIVSSFVQPEGVSSIHLYPNPSSGQVTVELLKRVPEPGYIEISNLFGKVLFTQEFPAKAARVPLDLSQFIEGFYLVKVKQKGLRELTKRLVISE